MKLIQARRPRTDGKGFSDIVLYLHSTKMGMLTWTATAHKGLLFHLDVAEKMLDYIEKVVPRTWELTLQDMGSGYGEVISRYELEPHGHYVENEPNP